MINKKTYEEQGSWSSMLRLPSIIISHNIKKPELTAKFFALAEDEFEIVENVPHS